MQEVDFSLPTCIRTACTRFSLELSISTFNTIETKLRVDNN